MFIKGHGMERFFRRNYEISSKETVQKATVRNLLAHRIGHAAINGFRRTKG